MKRTMCRFFLEGRCAKGAACGFAHSDGELGTPVAQAEFTLPTASVKRTLCRFFLEGKCEKGFACGFAHSEDELGQPLSAQSKASCQEAATAAPLEAVSGAPVKRSLCRHFESGHCERGELCGFAHGSHEIGLPSEVKRTMCKFFLEGTCAKGESCGFAHTEDELGAAIPLEAMLRPSDHLLARGVKRTLCRFFLDGHCRAGAACGFAHGEEELGAPDPTTESELPAESPAKHRRVCWG